MATKRTHKSKRKTRVRRNYKGGSNRSMKKRHVEVELKIPLFLKEINDTKLVKGQGYYFEMMPQSVYHTKKNDVLRNVFRR